MSDTITNTPTASHPAPNNAHSGTIPNNAGDTTIRKQPFSTDTGAHAARPLPTQKLVIITSVAYITVNVHRRTTTTTLGEPISLYPTIIKHKVRFTPIRIVEPHVTTHEKHMRRARGHTHPLPSPLIDKRHAATINNR